MIRSLRGPAGYEPWALEGWRGWRRRGVPLDIERWRAVASGGAGRTSRHARTLRLSDTSPDLWIKVWPVHGARRARRAFAMHEALRRAGFLAPVSLVVGWRADTGLLVTTHVEGIDLLEGYAALAGGGTAARAERRMLSRRLGFTVGRLHAAGFVHGDLVPSNVRLVGEGVCFLDNDRTRRIPFAIGGRRNLVQLGRFVVPGVAITDRMRVLRAYAEARGLSRRARRRLARWLVRKITARRCAIDHIARPAANAAGFRRLMQAGGPFDPARATPAAGAGQERS